MAGVGEAPDWLNEEGKAAWDYLLGSLDEPPEMVDRMAFTLMCAAYGSAEAAQKKLHELGPTVAGRSKEGEPGAPVKNPAEPVARQEMVQFISLAKEFGLTPAARKRMKQELKKTKTDDDGPPLD